MPYKDNVFVLEILSLNKQARMGYTEDKNVAALLVYRAIDDFFYEYDTHKWVPDYMVSKILTVKEGREKYPELFL